MNSFPVAGNQHFTWPVLESRCVSPLYPYKLIINSQDIAVVRVRVAHKHWARLNEFCAVVRGKMFGQATDGTLINAHRSLANF